MLKQKSYLLNKIQNLLCRKASGVTLLELMIAVAIIGILASLTVGGLSSMTPRMRLNKAVRDLRGDMERAKMIAVEKNTASVMSYDLSGEGSYSICVNATATPPDCSGGEILLQQNFAEYTSVSLQSASFTFGSYVRFNSRGLPENGAFISGTVNCTNNRGDVRSVKLSPTGRIRIE